MAVLPPLSGAIGTAYAGQHPGDRRMATIETKCNLVVVRAAQLGSEPHECKGKNDPKTDPHKGSPSSRARLCLKVIPSWAHQGRMASIRLSRRPTRSHTGVELPKICASFGRFYLPKADLPQMGRSFVPDKYRHGTEPGQGIPMAEQPDPRRTRRMARRRLEFTWVVLHCGPDPALASCVSPEELRREDVYGLWLPPRH